MAAMDNHGRNLQVNDRVAIYGVVSAINSDDEIVVTTETLNSPEDETEDITIDPIYVLHK